MGMLILGEIGDAAADKEADQKRRDEGGIDAPTNTQFQISSEGEQKPVAEKY
jgi:hypothetical protein